MPRKMLAMTIASFTVPPKGSTAYARRGGTLHRRPPVLAGIGGSGVEYPTRRAESPDAARRARPRGAGAAAGDVARRRTIRSARNGLRPPRGPTLPVVLPSGWEAT